MKIYSFSSFSPARLSQPLKGEYYKQLIELVRKNGLEGMIDPALWEAYKADVAHYFTLVSQYKASARTQDMLRYDRARTAVFQHLRQGLKMMRNYEDDKITEYYEMHVKPIVQLYNRYDVKKDGMSKTAEFRAFGRDVLKLKKSILRRAFVHHEEVEKLLELCDLFEDAYTTRNNVRSQFEDIPALLGKIQDRWQRISAPFVVIANKTVSDDNRAEVEASRRLIDDVNENSQYFREHYIRKRKNDRDELIPDEPQTE